MCCLQTKEECNCGKERRANQAANAVSYPAKRKTENILGFG